MAEILHTTSVDEVDFDAIEDAIQTRKRAQGRAQSEREMRANTHADSGSDCEPGEIADGVLDDTDDDEFSMIDGKFTYTKQVDPHVEMEIERIDTISQVRHRRTRTRHKPMNTENWSYADIYDDLADLADLDDGDWGDLNAEPPEPPEVRYDGVRAKKSRKPWWESDEDAKSADSLVLNRILKQLGNLQEKIESMETCLEDLASNFGDLNVKIDTIEEKVDEIREKVCFE
jgi:hypothetical protein